MLQTARPEGPVGRARLTPAYIARVAEQFRALGEPARLRILHALRGGELTVTRLTTATGLSQANVSKHLHLLRSLGLVTRRRNGSFTHYRVADDDIHRLCDLMCGRLREPRGRGTRSD